MVRRLNKTVLSGGVVYPAGQAETPELAAAITNPEHWDGEPDPDIEAAVVAALAEREAQLSARLEALDPAAAAAPVQDPAAAEHGAQPAPAPAVDYRAMSKPDLQAEVERRNDARGAEEPLVQVGGKGNKPDLIAALVAHDTARAHRDA